MDPNVNLYDELPSFANKENREIHKRILAKNAELASLTSECTELQDRLNVLQEHLKSVTSEVTITQQLLTEKERQAENEKHLTQLSEREYGRIISDLSRIEEQTTSVQAKWSEVQAKTFKSQQRIEAFKEEAQANEEQLQQWIQAARDKEEDFLVLQRYQKEDEGKIKAMLLEIEKSQGVVEAKKLELDNEVTQTRALQIELDMTADQFRKLHEERAQLLTQWENTLQQMQQLNVAIEKSTESFDAKKNETVKLNNLLREHKKELERAEAENKEMERKLAACDYQVSQKHSKYEREEAALIEFNETVETQRHVLGKIEGDIRFHKAEIEEIQRKTAQENLKKEEFKKRLQRTREALSTQKDSSEELQQQTNVMNEFLKREELTLKELEKTIEAEKNQIYKLGQQVFEERKREKNLLAEMQGSQTRIKNLQLKIHEFDRETQKQEELKYNSNFQIQQMERKISRIEGDRTEEEKVELQSQLDHLETVFQEKKEIEKLLAQQLRRLELDLRQTNRRKDNVSEVKLDLETKMNELRLDQDSLDKSTIKARSQKESVLVQINMLRLQVEKLGDQVALKFDELVSLENRRQQLQLSMEERILEIDTHIAGLRTQLKTEEEARHVASIELQERKKRVATLESKYGIMMSKYNIEGEEVSQAYQVIKFAQEREQIIRYGDELEQEVKTAVKELRALEKAMNKFDGQNAAFRKGFNAIGNDDADMERKKTLEEQRKVIQQRLNARKAEYRQAEEQHAATEDASNQQQDRITKLQDEIARVKPLVDKTAAENRDISEKIKRATLGLKKAREAHRKAQNIAPDAQYPATLTEMDIEIRGVKGIVDQALNDLANLAESNRELEPKLRLALSQIGLKMRALNSVPQRAATRPQTTSAQRSGLPSSASSGANSALSSARSAYSTRSNISVPSNASKKSEVSARSNISAGSKLSAASKRSAASTLSKRSKQSKTSQGSRGTVGSNHSNISELSITSVRSNTSQGNRGQSSQGPRVIKPVTPRRPGMK